LAIFTGGALFAALCWQVQFWAFWQGEAADEVASYEEKTREQMLAGQKAAVARARALATAKDEPGPVTWSHTFEPPKEALEAMFNSAMLNAAELNGLSPSIAAAGGKARREMMLDGAWSGTFEIMNQESGLLSAPTNLVSFSALGATAQLRNWDTVRATKQWKSGPPHLHAITDPPPPAGGPVGSVWFGLYIPFVAQVNVGMASNAQQLYLWVKDGYGLNSPLPTGGIDCYESIKTPFEMAVSNLYPKDQRVVTDTPVTEDRQPKDPTDFKNESTWYADANSEVTISLTLPDLSVLSISGSLGMAGEIDLGANPWGCTYTFDMHRYDADDVIYCRLSALQFNGIPVDLSRLDLSNPGTGDAPDADEPNWKRSVDSDCARIGNNGGIATWWTGAGNDARTWSCDILGPYEGVFIAEDGGHEDSTSYPEGNIEYEGPCITYTAPAVYTVDTWTGSKPYYEQDKSWEFDWEWKTLSTKAAVKIQETSAWRTLRGENVGGATAAKNDQQCALLCHPINKDYTGSPIWDLLTISHDSSLNVNVPPALASRPTFWEGSTGVFIPPWNNDCWAVGARTTSPTITRTFASRHYLRLNRLAGGVWVPELQYHPDWPIMLKPNAPITDTHDDPDWWSSATGGVDGEDSWYWHEWGYLLLELAAPIDGQISLQVDYSINIIADPCYTCATSRWADWTYTRTRRVVTYTVQVASGRNTVLIDLLKPDEGVIPEKATRLFHVDKLTFRLPANNTGVVQKWWLNGLNLVADPGTSTRAEPSIHFEARAVRSWDWPARDWFGFGAIVDGKDALETDYGYDNYRYEQKLLYIQKVEHCPGSASTTELHHLKDLSRLAQELLWRDGWSATWNNPQESPYNKDADDNRLAAMLYWFDLQNAHEWKWASGSQTLDGAVQVGQTNLLAGVHQEWRFQKLPRIRGHGLAYRTGGGARARNRAAAVRIDQRALGSGDSWVRACVVGTDEHGRFRSTPLLEKDMEYRVRGTSTTFEGANREYTSFGRCTIAGLSTGGAVDMFRFPAGNVPAVVSIEGDDINFRWLDQNTTWTPPVVVDSSGDYDSVDAETDGNSIWVVARRASDEKMFAFVSEQRGLAGTWSAPIPVVV